MTDKENKTAFSTEDTQRKIFVLPKELVDRIVQFQTKHGYPSEVEAVRHLLNKALLLYQTPDELMSEVAMCANLYPQSLESMVKGLLMGHPLVASLNIQKNGYFITLENDDEFKISRNGEGLMKKTSNGIWVAWYPSTRNT